MNLLGLRLCDHDSNITLAQDSKIKYYKAERDWQVKHVGYNNLTSWLKVLHKWNINLSEIDAIGIVINSYHYKKLKINHNNIVEEIDIPLFRQLGYKGPIFRFDHHYAHSLSCWTLNVEEDIGIVFDGIGDDEIVHSIFSDSERRIFLKNKTHPSFGLLMGYVGDAIGLNTKNMLDMAGKVMALKGYGHYSKEDIKNIKILKNTEKLNLSDISNFWDLNYLGELSIQDDQDKIYNHIQMCHEITEDIFERYFTNQTKENDIITYSGGVALNTIINSKIKRKRPNLHIPPHANDEGLSLGIVEGLRKIFNGPKFDTEGFPYWQSDEAPKSLPSDKTIRTVAEMLSVGKIIGWYQGNGEIGPRSLGNRSILMNPSIKNGKEIINNKVKHREYFRPFGASILEKNISDYFDWEGESPYMLYVMDIKDKKSFPSITHVDGTCRPQTVSNKLETYYSLISEFENITGIPMLLNTSLNTQGNPIAGNPRNALQLLNDSDLDAVVIGDSIYTKYK